MGLDGVSRKQTFTGDVATDPLATADTSTFDTGGGWASPSPTGFSGASGFDQRKAAPVALNFEPAAPAPAEAAPAATGKGELTAEQNAAYVAISDPNESHRFFNDCMAGLNPDPANYGLVEGADPAAAKPTGLSEEQNAAYLAITDPDESHRFFNDCMAGLNPDPASYGVSAEAVAGAKPKPTGLSEEQNRIYLAIKDPNLSHQYFNACMAGENPDPAEYGVQNPAPAESA